ncbi:helix-turn-helix domain-containing protein [Blautia producta]|uniref:helix-turn-helix domain-containing protein n=1 Tax=Blautia producta TaxID=33035 RepID=UPI0031B59E5A
MKNREMTQEERLDYLIRCLCEESVQYWGLLRRELADMVGVSEATILNYGLGYMPIGYDNAKKLAEALQIDEQIRTSYSTWECASVRPGREPFAQYCEYMQSQGKVVI